MEVTFAVQPRGLREFNSTSSGKMSWGDGGNDMVLPGIPRKFKLQVPTNEGQDLEPSLSVGPRTSRG